MLYHDDVTLLTGLARNKELLGEMQESNECYKKVLNVQANNIEAIACIETNCFYDDKPEIALRYYRYNTIACHYLIYENITRTYLTNVGGHFKEIDLKDELCRYKATGRAKKSVSATLIDFYRHIFKQLCFDPSDIWFYAVRINGARRDTTIKDLPNELTLMITDFTLDALGLARPELSSSANVQQFHGTNNSFWLSLGACDEVREERFKSLMEAKATFTVDSRVAMAEALEDLRSYRFFNGALIPAKKNGKIEIGLGRSDKKRMSPEEWIVAVGNGTDEC
ncbi:hypothetical protein ANCCAN_09833 [Ancylostoma caninum]|uniref:Tetratricopeptide repeat protein n=1 Tax=Ancylostoma caninum TaxID=29170 RepID=A0A368GMD6_ANCCA|nr:hypothetical protein ANCCAN_09833 [Ancylostoma caninum]